MRLPRNRRALAVAGGLALLGLAVVMGAIVVPGVVRARAVAAAGRRHATLRIGLIRLEPWGVRLHDVVASLDHVEGIELRASDVDVRFRWNLSYERIEVREGALTLVGSESVLTERVNAWRTALARSPAPSRQASDVVLSAQGMTVRWSAPGDPAEPRLEATDVSVQVDPQVSHIDVGSLSFHTGPSVGVAASHGSVTLQAGSVLRARAQALTLAWNLPSENEHDALRADDPARSGPLSAAEPQGSAWALPEVRSLRAKIAVAAALLKERLSPAADIGVDALTWKIGRPDEQIALTIGPGPLDLDRTSSGFELRFSTNASAAGAAALSFQIFLPTVDGRDPTIGLAGGPVSLALLGVSDGAVGLTDVRDTTVNGQAQLAIAQDGSALTFDAEADARGLAIRNARLSPDLVRGVDVQVRARGVLDAGGELRLDDFGVRLGAIQFDASGVVQQAPGHLIATLRFGIPSTKCQMLLDSVPAALLPVLQGMRVAGAFGVNGRLAFDTQALDALRLDYDIRDSCTVTTVPAALAPDQFQHPFEHHVYLPDGSVGDQLTGPGTTNWTPLDQISPYMQVAVLTTEDGAFRKHHGFNRASIRASLIANLKAHRFVRGASTITMQLAKNLFLAREKTLARKLEEVVLTEYLEQSFTKDELMELYLNVIEFGPAIYGITSAAEYYFGRTPAELDLAECLFLSSLLPSPLRYGAMRELGEAPEGWMRLLRSLMVTAHDLGRITDAELAEATGERVVFWRSGERPTPRAPIGPRAQLEGQSEEDLGAPASDPPEESP